MNSKDFTQNGIDFIHGYCLNTMSEVFFSVPHGYMGALFNCPKCGPILDKVDTETEHLHIFHPNKKLIDALKKV